MRSNDVYRRQVTGTLYADILFGGIACILFCLELQVLLKCYLGPVIEAGGLFIVRAADADAVAAGAGGREVLNALPIAAFLSPAPNLGPR